MNTEVKRPGRCALPLLLVGALASSHAVADGARLVVELQAVRDDAGQVRASLYREPDSFRKEDRALQVVSLPARAGSLTLEFEDVPPGRYALMVYHDANADQKLNLRFGMFPTEGHGLSNNPKVMGPPRFEDSDPNGILRAMVYYPMSNGRSIDEFVRLLQALQASDTHGVATPENWCPGKDVIVPPPKTAEAADKRGDEGYNTVDWYFSTRSL